MSDRIRIGFAGAGWMGREFIDKIERSDAAELALIYEPDEASRRAAVDRFGLESSVFAGSYEELVEDGAVDAVMIASPNSSHDLQSLAALDAGKNVFCEKPNSTRWDRHLRMVRSDEARPDLVTMTNYTLYFSPMERRIKRMIDDGAFGRILQVQANYRHAVNIEGSRAWKLRREAIGDALGMGITHAVFLMCWFLSPVEPVRVYAHSRPSAGGRFEVPPVWTLLITFSDGCCGVVLGDIESGRSYDIYQNLYGTAGGLVYDSQLEHAVRLRYRTAETEGTWVYPMDHRRKIDPEMERFLWPTDTPLPDSGDVRHHHTADSFAHFVDCLQRGQTSPLGFSPMRVVQDISFAAQLSALRGEPIRVPADPAALEELSAEAG